MNNSDLIAVIEKYNLCIRRIPEQVVSLWTAGNAREGDEIVEKNGRKFVRKVHTPSHPGWYMVKAVNHSDCQVHWNIKKDNLAETLEGSISLFLKSLSDVGDKA